MGLMAEFSNVHHGILAWPRSSQQKKLEDTYVSTGREVMSQAGPEGEETVIYRRAPRRRVSAHFPSTDRTHGRGLQRWIGRRNELG